MLYDLPEQLLCLCIDTRLVAVLGRAMQCLCSACCSRHTASGSLPAGTSPMTGQLLDREFIPDHTLRNIIQAVLQRQTRGS
jgi:hypothetical protein